MRTPLVFVAALASAASVITAAPASATPPPPVEGVTVTSSLDATGDTIATISWSSVPAGTDGVRVCGQQGIHPATDPNACDTYTDTDTSSAVVYLDSGKTYAFSVFAYARNGNAKEFSEPVTTQAWHGTKVRFRIACGIPTFGVPCRFDAFLTDTRIDAKLQGERLQLMRGPAERNPAWHVYDADRTDFEGNAHVPVTMRKPQYFQWQYQGVQGILASSSYQTRLEPRFHVTAHLSRSTAQPGENVKIYGIVRPRIDGLRVFLDEWQTSPCHAWFSTGLKAHATRQRLPNGTTTFGYVITLSRSTPGTHRFIVNTESEPDFRSGSSDEAALTIGSAGIRGASRNAPGVPAC